MRLSACTADAKRDCPDVAAWAQIFDIDAGADVAALRSDRVPREGQFCLVKTYSCACSGMFHETLFLESVENRAAQAGIGG